MKKVLLIGASGGIGYQVMENLLEQGYYVIATYHSKEIELRHENLEIHQLDISNQEDIINFTNNINSLYALVNASGVAFFENTEEDNINIWNKTIAINLTANYIFFETLKNKIEKNGRFIMVSSTDAMFGGEITSAYAASKAGVNSLTKSFGLMAKEYGFKTNSIAPGWVETEMLGDDKEFAQEVAKINPLGRIAMPKDISNWIKILLSEQATYLNGQVITVDGGYTNQDPSLILEAQLDT